MSDFYKEILTVLTPITEEKEEYFLVNQDLPVEPEGAIKYSLNLAEFPIFSKNDKIKPFISKRYIFDERGTEFVRVVPNGDGEALSNKILQEFDEKIFYGILNIYEKSGNKKIITDYVTLLKVSGMKYDGRSLFRAKDSLQRMNGCQIIFNKVYYDAVAKKNGFEFLKRTKNMTLITGLETVSFEKYEGMNDKEREDFSQHFDKHHKIKEIAFFYLNEDIANNLDCRAFKYFDHDGLLEIENGVARKLFVLLTKWRYWEKSNKITRNSKFLASRIPLSWKNTNIPGTIRTLRKACEYLKKKKKIFDFKFVGKGKGTLIEFYFEKDNLHPYNIQIGTETTGQEALEIIDCKVEIIESLPNPLPDNKVFNGLMDLIPSEHAKSIEEIVLENLTNKGADYVKKAIDYTNSKQPDDYPAYLASALRKDYAVNHDPNKSQYSKIIQKALKCFNGCNGSCAGEWKRYADNKSHECHWCKKFERQRMKDGTCQS